MPGLQGAAGTPAMIPFWRAGQGNDPARFAMMPSEGLQTTREQIKGQQVLQGNQLGFQGQQAGLDRAFQGAQGDASRANQMSIANLPYAFKNRVFDTVSPLLSGLMNGQGSAFSFGQVGGTNTPQPQITAAPVYTDQQTNQQVNNQQSQNASKAAAQMRTNSTGLAGQGWGANSPLLAALNSGVQNQLMASNATAARETPFMAAQANAKQLLAGQQAQESQWGDLQQADIARRQQQLQAQSQAQNYTTSLISALAGMV